MKTAILTLPAIISLLLPAMATGQTRQMQSLDGPWDIVFDSANAGRQAGWQSPEVFAKLPNRREIAVPSCWEEFEKDYEGVAWYRREFAVPDEWKDRHVRIRFHAVNYRAELWVNGEVVGSHEGGYGPFEFDIGGNLRFGEPNTMIVRVAGPAVISEQVDDLVRNASPHWRGGYVGGIWQSVQLIANDPLYVAGLFVKPRLETKEAEAEIRIANASMQPRKITLASWVTVQADPENPLASHRIDLEVAPGEGEQIVTLAIPGAMAWSPDNPHLYRFRVQLSDAEKPIDALETRFGMRSFTVKNGDFHLNGQRIFIKGAFWEGQYPNTLAVPRDLDMVRREIRMAKEAGFNMLRPWRMPPIPAILDLCDEMGMLLSGAPAVENMGYWPEETPQMERRWTEDMVSMVKRDRNHPSIVLWETANEIIRKSNLLPRHRISLAARAADPTRLIIDESGGSRAPWGSHAYLPYSSVPMPMIDRHIYNRAPVSEQTYQHLATYGEADQVTLISEVGYGGAPDFTDNARRYLESGNPKAPDYRFHLRMQESLDALMDRHHLRGMFPDASAFCLATQKIQAAGNKLQLEALRINPKADGYCLHAYTDGDWVIGAGVLDLWRRPKLLYEACREVQQPLYLAIHADPQNVYAWKGTRLSVTTVNDGPAQKGRFELVLNGPGGLRRVLMDESRTIPAGIQKVFEQHLDTKGLGGELRIDASFEGTRGAYPILVLKQDDLSPPPGPVAVVDPKQQLQIFLKDRGISCQSFAINTGVATPVLVAQPDVWSENEKRRMRELIDWVARGGCAIWLRPPVIEEYHGQPIYREPDKNYMMQLRGQKEPWRLTSSSLIAEGIFPFQLRSRSAEGNWIPVGHYARMHPVFEGLPSGGLMGQPCQNVAATSTIVNLPEGADELAGCLSWDVHYDYRGPTEWWHGADLAVVKHGKGRLILSMLRIPENLGHDPVADKILYNLIQFSTR